jgi:hypothetical protein
VVRVVADARLNPDFGPLDRLELVVSGDVVETARGGTDTLQLAKDLRIDRGVWVAVRAYGASADSRNMRVAHSAPIFVTIDETGFAKPEALPQLVAGQRQLLAELVATPVDPMGDLEPWETKQLMLDQYQRQLVALGPRIEEADRRYRALLEDEGRALTPLVVPRHWPFPHRDSTPPAQSPVWIGIMVGLAAAALAGTRLRPRLRRSWTT